MARTEHRSWTEAFAEELRAIEERRAARQRGPGTVDGGHVERSLVGLALSGGGIRSATFGLGVLESLKRSGRLADIDYLSTVSGGGYIGAWLSANCRRHPDWLSPSSDWNQSIAHLRRYSNYLSPTVGFFSADTWSMATIWLRNTLLLQTTVLLAIACVLLLPRPMFELFQHWPLAGTLRWASIILYLIGVVGIAGNQMRLTSRSSVTLLHSRSWRASLALTTLCIVVAWMYGRWAAFDPFGGGEVTYAVSAPIAALLVLAAFVLQPLAVQLVATVWPDDDPPQQINYTQNWVQAVVVLPLMLAAYLVSAILWGESSGAPGVPGLNVLTTYGELVSNAWRFWPFPLSVVFASFWLLSFCAVRSRREPRALLVALAAPLVAVPVLHALLCAVMVLMRGWGTSLGDGAAKAFVWGPPLVAYAFVLSIVVLIGMLGRQSTDGIREWWSRLGAWLGIYSTAWLVVTVCAVYGFQWVQDAIDAHPWTALGAGGGWVGTVVAGLLAGNSPATGTREAKSPLTRAKELIATAAPFVFIAGMLIAVAYTVDAIVRVNSGLDWTSSSGYVHAAHAPFLQVSMALFAACLSALVLMAARVDINEFSLNAFYRNRLVRCYLGASRFHPGVRNPQNFTGFDEADDIAMNGLAGRGSEAAGPFPVINCALNLGGSSDLALHTRHSASFTVTPLLWGSAYASRDQSGETRQLGYLPMGPDRGGFGTLTLGQAISVSGAAASPNMGYHTSPVVAFLLTVFNVRLGWWFANPGKPELRSASPLFSLRYLFAELFGSATDKSDYVMVSDGGHFENLAAYELVRRRCRLIIVSDAECDPNLTFEGLGTLIRMCDVDFGVRISIDVGGIRRPPESAWSAKRWAVGRIEYGDGGPDGILIYLKASMNGSEDTSVLQYQSSHRAFPHESTGDQFYGEDQFESYRRLGRDIGMEVFGAASEAPDLMTAAATQAATTLWPSPPERAGVARGAQTPFST